MNSIEGNFLLIYICNFHVLSNLLLIYICKLHWNPTAKVQSIFNYDDVIMGILDPNAPTIVKIRMLDFLFNAMIEVEMKVMKKKQYFTLLLIRHNLNHKKKIIFLITDTPSWSCKIDMAASRVNY